MARALPAASQTHLISRHPTQPFGMLQPSGLSTPCVVCDQVSRMKSCTSLYGNNGDHVDWRGLWDRKFPFYFQWVDATATVVRADMSGFRGVCGSKWPKRAITDTVPILFLSGFGKEHLGIPNNF